MSETAVIEAIKQKLSKYAPNDVAKEVLRQAKILLMVGITASGRNSLISELTSNDKFHFVVSHTTRPPRVNNGVPERDGIEYHFINHAQLQAMLEQKAFVECKLNHQQDFYGTSVAEIQKAVESGKIAITDIEVKGVEEYIKLKPDTLCVFVLPPSFDEWLARLTHRGSNESPQVLSRRIESAQMELQMALDKHYYHFVINDDLVTAATIIQDMALENKFIPANDQAGRVLASQLLQDVRKYLQTA